MNAIEALERLIGAAAEAANLDLETSVELLNLWSEVKRLAELGALVEAMPLDGACYHGRFNDGRNNVVPWMYIGPSIELGFGPTPAAALAAAGIE